MACFAGGLYSQRKADRYSRGSGGSRCCKSGEGSWTSQLPQSSPPKILVYSTYTNTQEKKERERPEWGTSLTRRVFLSRPIKKKQVWQQWNKRERLTKLAGLQGEVYSPTNQRLCLQQSLHILAWQNKTDLGSDLLSCHALSWRDAACRKWNNRITLLCKLTMKSVTNPKPYLDNTNMPNERAPASTCF